MPINNITQTISTIPEAGHRGIDVQTVFVNKQEDFQDHLQGTTVTELNTLKTQMNTMAGEMNTTASQVNTDATTASASATTATTKASEASASASQALTSRNQAETFAQQAQASATSVDVNNIVHRTDNETIAGVKTFSSTIVGSVSGNAGTATKLATARTINGVSFDGSANITVSDSTAVKLTGNQTIAGVKTFNSSPVVPTPTAETQAVNKNYADTKQSKSELAYDVDTSSYIPNTLASGVIIERGSNANGEYIKYADGTLICTGVRTQSVGMDLLSLGLYRSSGGEVVGTYPHVFSSKAYFVPKIEGATSICVQDGGSSSTAWNALCWSGTSSTQNVTIRFIAIGKWK